MLIDKKLLLFGGKGGVGKTTMAAATALHAASLGKNVLVMSTDPAHSLGDSLSTPVADTPTPIAIESHLSQPKNSPKAGKLVAREIDAASLLAEYKKKNGGLLQQIADEGTFFSKDEIKKFFDLSLPGMDELMALFEVMKLLDNPEYDLIILDTAPTGHTIRLLELPEILTGYVKVLAEMRMKHRVVVRMMTRRYIKDKADQFIDELHADIENVKKALSDPAMTQFVPVTIPEPMSIQETERLLAALDQHAIPVTDIIINLIIQPGCSRCVARKSHQESSIETIKKKFSKYSLIKVPLLPVEARAGSLGSIVQNLFSKESPSDPKTAAAPQKVSPKKTSTEPKKPLSALSASPSKLVLSSKRRFILFGGKGGVGKTTMAAAAALQLSKQKNVLLFSTDPAHSVSDSLQTKNASQIKKINSGLDILEIDSSQLLDQFKQRYKTEIMSFFNSILPRDNASFRGTIDIPYDRKVMEDLFDLCPPGIDEIMALRTILDFMNKDTYDCYILDTAPSGHTIRLLEMPDIALAWVTTLSDILDQYPLGIDIQSSLVDIKKTIEQVRELLTHDTSEFITVAIPEMMALLETRDLFQRLTTLNMKHDNLIINKLIPVSDCDFCKQKRSTQVQSIKEFEKLRKNIVVVPWFDETIQGKSLKKIQEVLF